MSTLAKDENQGVAAEAKGSGLTWERIEAAGRRLAGVAIRTPVLRSRQFDEAAGASVYFKAENFQRAGAFKFRGAYNKLKSELESRPVSSIVAFSSGNHAQAVAVSARLLGLPATIVMPSDAPAAKLAATRGYGAEIILYDRYKENREEIGARLVRERGAMLVPPFDDYEVMAGQATAAVELMEDAPDLDAVVVPVSGGGLIAGCAVAARHLRPGIAVYGTEPEAASDTAQSLAKGERVSIDIPHTIADGLQVASPGKLTFPIVQENVAGVLLVSDEELVDTLCFILERMKILVEPSGVAGAAAVRHKKADFAGKKVGVILSGGNVDREKLAGYLLQAGTARA